MSELVSVQSRGDRLVTITLIGQRSCSVNFKKFTCKRCLFGFHSERMSVYRNKALALEAAAEYLGATTA